MTHRIRVRRGRARRRARRPSGRFVVSAVAAGAILTVLGSHHSARSPAAGSRPQSPAAAAAIAYARAQLGKPYRWGGPTAPGTSDGFDCSGLVMMAWRSAGVPIERTSQRQWATERHVSGPQPGDLVFYAGSDGTVKSPGHVALVTGGGQMIEAYGTGYPVRKVPIRPDWVGFTDPAAGGAG